MSLSCPSLRQYRCPRRRHALRRSRSRRASGYPSRLVARIAAVAHAQPQYCEYLPREAQIAADTHLVSSPAAREPICFPSDCIHTHTHTHTHKQSCVRTSSCSCSLSIYLSHPDPPPSRRTSSLPHSVLNMRVYVSPHTSTSWCVSHTQAQTHTSW